MPLMTGFLLETLHSQLFVFDGPEGFYQFKGFVQTAFLFGQVQKTEKVCYRLLPGSAGSFCQLLLVVIILNISSRKKNAF